MILSERLHKLLTKWNFDEALAIYQEHGDSDTMKFLFSQPWSQFIEDQLMEEIKEMAALTPVVEHEIIEARKEQIRTASSLPAKLTYPEDEIDYPKELQELVKIRKGLFSRSNHARYILFTKAETEKERKELALQIKADWREIERIWNILNFWKKHKTLSPELITVDTGEMTVKEMASRITNLRTYISKSKVGKKKYKLSIDEMEAELRSLERRMNGIV